MRTHPTNWSDVDGSDRHRQAPMSSTIAEASVVQPFKDLFRSTQPLGKERREG